MRKILLLAVVFATSFTAFGQDFSNKGKDFWLCFASHCPNSNATTSRPTLSIFITSDKASTGTVTMPNGGYSASFNLNAGNNYFQELIVNPGGAPGNIYISAAESNTVINKSIHVKTNAGQPPVVVYAEEWAGARTAASLILPVAVLGKKYYAVSASQAAPSGGVTIGTINYVSKSHFQIIATQNNTTVQITPKFNGITQTPFAINLPNAGDLYQYAPANSSTDITGTFIESLAGSGSGCLPIAVFSGTSGIALGASNPPTSCTSPSSSDPLFQQLYPTSSWGKNFGFIQFTNYVLGNPYRIIASEDNTNVYFNGVLQATLNAGQLYPNNYAINPPTLTAPTNITADKPICVAQYLQSNGCSNTIGGNLGDPDMVILNPIEQNISDITVFSSGQQAITQRFLNVLIKTAGTTSFKINGGAPSTAWLTSPNLPGFSYLKGEPLLSTGSYHLFSDSGFNAIAYGYGANESYAYSAGTNVKDLTKQLQIETTYGIETSPSVCTNAPFKFKVYFPAFTQSSPPQAILFDSLKWDMSDPSIISPNNFPVMYHGSVGSPPTVAIDSTNTQNGVLVNWYSLPSTYHFISPGLTGYDTLLVTGYTSTNEGCGTTRDYEFSIQISDPPTASFSVTTPGCYAEPVLVNETTPQLPKATYRTWWEFYDPATSPPTTTEYTNAPPNPPNPTAAIRTQSHTFTTPGVKRIRHASITTPGCLSDTIVQFVTLPDIPNATIAGNIAVCLNSVPFVPITFTGTGGTAPYIFNYNINGTPQTPVVSDAAGIAIVNAPTNVAGPFRYNLVGVSNATPAGTPCTRPISNVFVDVMINPLPAAAVTGGTTVCLNDASPVVTFTGSGGTAPYTFNYTINTVPQAPVVSNAAGVYTINAPTNVPGPFDYTINLITDASSTTCSSVTSVSTIITVNDLPNAAISGGTDVCLNAPQPFVTFTSSGGTAPYTFNYTINTVAQPPLVSNAAGVATVNVPTNVAGPFTYALVSVREGSAITCFRGGLSGNTVFNINPLPAAAIGGATTVCLNAAPPPVTFTGSGGTAPYTFNYTINTVAQPPVVSNAAGVAVINAPTNVAGPFNYTITTVTDASTTLCASNPNVSTLITVNDLPNASISGATTVCLNATQPVITFTGSGGTAPYTFNYTINTVAQPPVVSNAAGVATVNAPTNVAGPFTYELVSVQEGSAISCIRTGLSGSTLITVNPLPTGVISGATAVCRNAASPFVTFTGSGATAPYTFTYTINAVAQPPIVSDAAGVATIAAPTNVAGPFTYVLTSVRDASSTLCSQSIAGQQTIITINQLPVASFTVSTPRCANSTITFTNTSTANAAGPTTWAWSFGDPYADPPGGPNENTSTLLSPSHYYLVPNTTTGYTVTLNAINSNGCISNPDASVIVTVNDTPRAGFIVPDVCINDVATIFTDTSKIVGPDVIVRPSNQWNYGDPFATPGNPNTSTGINGSHLYTQTGVYPVTQTVTSNNGCTNSKTIPITINSADPVSDFTAGNQCSSDSVDLRNLSTVGFGSVTKLEIYWNYPAGPPQIILAPTFNGIYRHKYPTLQTTQTYSIRMIAYSGVICFNTTTKNVTVYATPKVQFNNIPSSCYLVAPFQITQASEIGGVPGTGTYSGPGITNPTGTFNPQVAGIGTHDIKYTFTASNPGACIDTLTKTITVLDTAHAVFSVALPSCEKIPTVFTNLSTTPAGVVLVSTVWNFGDGPPQTFPIASPITHLYAGPGPYTVSMHNVSDNLPVGCLSTDTAALINIDPDHSITFDASGGSKNQTRCVNVAIQDIKFTLAGGANDIVMPVAGLPAGLTATVSGSGPYTVTISGTPTTAAGSPFNYSILTKGNTCAVASETGTITVEPDHEIKHLSSAGDSIQSVCLNTAINDIKYDLGGGATGATISGLPAGVSYSVTGTTLTITGTPVVTVPYLFKYMITTTGNSCVKASDSGSIRVNPYPVPNFAVDKPSYCIPNALVLFDNTSSMPDGNPNMTYSWNFGEFSNPNNTSSAFEPSHWYLSEGPFNVHLIVTSVPVSGPGCSHDTTIAITTIHPQPKADFVFSKPSVCIGDNVTITDATDGKDGIVNQWHWDMGDAGVRITNPVTYTYPDTITYTITMYSINSHGCNSDTVSKPFTVYPYPKVNAGPDKFVLEGGSVELEATAFARQPVYTWTPIDYLTDSKILRPRTMNPKTDMTYRLTVTGQGGCQLSDDVFVKLLKFPAIPNTFTPNGDGINDLWRIDYLNTYPDNRVQIFTRAGKLVFESKGYISPWDGTLKGKPLPFDTYYYIIEPGNGRDPITGYITILK